MFITIKGLEDAYKKLKEEIDNKFTKEDKIKLARKRLMTGKDDSFTFEKELYTQKSLKLVLYSNGSSSNCCIDLAIPTISFSTFYNGDFKCSYLSSINNQHIIKSYGTLCSILEEETKGYDENNILDVYGKLKVIYYNNLIFGIKDEEIVFIYCLFVNHPGDLSACMCSDDNIKLRVGDLPITELEIRDGYSSSYYWSR